MRVAARMNPGARGTRRFVEEYGDRLVCVRYRYDIEHRRRYTTVELIVDEGDWIRRRQPPVPEPDDPVFVRIAPNEHLLRRFAESSGARWDPRRRLWRVLYAVALGLDLEDRIVPDPIRGARP